MRSPRSRSLLKAHHVCLALCCIFGGAARLRAAAPTWLKLETKDFVVYTDAPQKDLVEYAVRYAAFRTTLNTMFAPPGRRLPPSTLVLFRRDALFQHYTPKPRDSDATLVNYSVEIDGTPHTAMPVSDGREQALAFTYEFETIWSIKKLGYSVPVWMSQGAGEVLSTLRLKKGHCYIGADREGGNSDTIPWEHFFEISETSPEYSGRRATGLFHAQAWGLMHWILLRDAQTRERTVELATRLQHMPALEAVTTAMQCTPRELSRNIRNHLFKWDEPREIPFDEAAVRSSFVVAPALPAEVIVQKVNLLESLRRTVEADAELEKARAVSPELAVVKEAWARRRLREGRVAEAVDLYREAIAAGSRNFTAYLQSATQRLNDNMTGNSDVAGDGGPEAMVAITEARQALALNPGNVDAHRLLARALFVAPKLTRDDVAELSAGVALDEKGATRYYRALIHARLKDDEAYLADLRVLAAEPGTNAATRESAQRRVVEADAAKVNKLVREKNYDAARALVTSAASEPGASAENYDRLRQWIDEQQSWVEVSELSAAKEWAKLKAAADAFAAKFPSSTRLGRVAEMAAEAKKNAASTRSESLAAP